MDNFKNNLAEILETDSVEMDQELASFESWDSLAILSIIALTDDSFGVTLNAEEINNAKTIGGLIGLIESKKQ